jgi:transketolase C-terminal domain/subunit
VDRGTVMMAPTGGHARAGSLGALVVESQNAFRPSMMVGACVRGTFGSGADRAAIAERYGLDVAEVPSTVELQVERVTSWRGFSISTSVPRQRRLRMAQ